VNDGRLVAFEGIDGAGKSTQLARLAAALRAQGRSVVETREPTDGPWGRRIRAMARAGERVAPAEELRWFVEDRREHVAQVIRPAIAAGAVVLTDRYFLSTVAYQGARGLDPERLLAEAEAEFPLPDLALVLDVDPAGLGEVDHEAVATHVEHEVLPAPTHGEDRPGEQGLGGHDGLQCRERVGIEPGEGAPP